jgi:Tol biopolymer transport system component
MARRTFTVISALSGALLSLSLATAAAAPTTVRASVATDGTQGNDFSGLAPSSISADGRYIVFDSYATNLIAGKVTQGLNAYVRDTVSGTTALVSVGLNGAQGDDFSSNPSISADGRYVVFESYADNLVAGDTNAIEDVFMRDLTNNTTTLVSVGALGRTSDEGNIGGGSEGPVVSGDGRYVAFTSDAAGLGTGDVASIYVRDTQAGTTTLVSAATGGGEANDTAGDATISADGRYVAFESTATNLVPDDTNGIQDVFVRNLKTGATTLVSVGASGIPDGSGGVTGGSGSACISGDGRYIAFESDAAGVVTANTNGVSNVFIRDTLAHTTTQMSLAKNGGQADGSSGGAALSSDGRHIAFTSHATDLTNDVVTGYGDVFIRDVANGRTTLASVSQAGAALTATSGHATVSADGRYVAFQSESDAIVPGDTNVEPDAFVRGPLYSTDPGLAAMADGAVRSSPTAVDGIVYFGDDTGKLHAVYATDGAAVPGFPVDVSDELGYPVTIESRPAVYYTTAGKGIYFVTGNGSGFRVNPDGTGLSGYPTPSAEGNVSTPAVLPDGTVFMGVSTDSGTVIVRFDANWQPTAFVELGNRGCIISAVAVAGNKVYVGLSGGGSTGDIVVLNATDLTPLSSGVATGEGVLAPPYVVGQDMYVGTLAGNFYKLNSSNNEVDTSFGDGGKVSIGESLPTSPFFNKDAFYVGSSMGKVWKIGVDGSLSLAYDTGDPWAVGGVVVAANTLAFGTGDGLMYRVPLNGDTPTSSSALAAIETTPTYDPSTGLFFVGSDDGNLYRF